MSELGHSRKSTLVTVKSAFHLRVDIASPSCHVRKVRNVARRITKLPDDGAGPWESVNEDLRLNAKAKQSASNDRKYILVRRGTSQGSLRQLRWLRFECLSDRAAPTERDYIIRREDEYSMRQIFH